MKIVGELKSIENNPQLKLVEGNYLSISINDSDPKYVNIDEFDKNIRPKDAQDVGVAPAGVASKENVDQNADHYRHLPDYTEALKYLKSAIGFNNSFFKNDDNELIIVSNYGDFLDLPWEDLQDDIFVLRRVSGGNAFNLSTTNNNFILLISFADKNDDGDQGILKDKIVDESIQISRYLLDAEPKNFEVGMINLQKHLTKEKFNIIDWNGCSFMHVMMHGTEKGNLCFESSDMNIYKKSDEITSDEFLDKLQNDNFLLLFLSTCFSGGGIKNDDCLAFQAAFRGIAKYIIGYRYGINNELAAIFATKFYELLSNNYKLKGKNPIESIFKEALSKYRIDHLEYKKNNDIPIIYIIN